MKTKNILLAACMLAGGMLMTACMDGDWDAPRTRTHLTATMR